MNWMEVALLILGIGTFIASFVIPEKKKGQNTQQIDAEIIRSMIEKELETAKNRVTEVVDETLDYAVEKTERASERISNEKIMAISEYSDTVMKDLNKTHQEVMFLYDMLNDKHKNLKETVKKVDQQTKEAEEKANLMREKQVQLENTLQAAEKQPTVEQVLTPLPVKQVSMIDLVAENNAGAVEIEKQGNSQLQETVMKQEHSDIERAEDETVKPVKQQMKQVEVYSFAEQAPHIERAQIEKVQTEKTQMAKPVSKEVQAVNLEKNVNRAKKQQAIVPESENNNDKILRLYRAGISSVDIAKELGLGVGEVKLVINLFKGAV